MARKSNPLKQREALAIAKKLGADVVNDGAHKRATFFHEGVLICSFGIRHARDVGHGHIPRELNISQHQAVKMANCTMSKDEYVAVMRTKGVI